MKAMVCTYGVSARFYRSNLRGSSRILNHVSPRSLNLKQLIVRPFFIFTYLPNCYRIFFGSWNLFAHRRIAVWLVYCYLLSFVLQTCV